MGLLFARYKLSQLTWGGLKMLLTQRGVAISIHVAPIGHLFRSATNGIDQPLMRRQNQNVEYSLITYHR